MHASFASGLRDPEGPVALSDGGLLLVEMGAGRECVTRISPDGRRSEICRTGGRPTGIAIDGDGCYWVAGGPGASVVRLSPDGRELRRVDGDEDGPFFFPNDLAFGPDGLLYVTDTGARARDLIAGLATRADFLLAAKYDGRVYAIDPRLGRVVRKIASGLQFANGIAFDAAGHLYFNETLTGNVYRQTSAGTTEIYGNVLATAAGDRFKGPDGMAFDSVGRLFCVVHGEGQICVLSKTGSVERRIPTNGQHPTNIAFAISGAHAFVTEMEHGAVELVPVDTPGLPLHQPRLD